MMQTAETTVDVRTFEVGDWAVHPAHGVGRVDAVEVRSFGDQAASVYVLSIVTSELKIMVPVSSASSMGLRPVMSLADAERVLQSLTLTDIAVPPQTWNRRLRAYNELLSSGAPMEVAKVLRDMRRIKLQKDLSFGEKRLLEQATGLVVQELALAKGCSSEAAIAEVNAIFEAS